MNKPVNIRKITSVVILGNILEYYDFLLFAHLGVLITPLFFPNHSSTQTHILSLMLFGLSFVIRPIGAFIFGRISDLKGRKTALIQSVRWAVFPAIGFALLPSFETIGLAGSYLFVLFRLLQGLALGGELPVAGTYLMEMRKQNQGLFSTILVASGTVGSLIGLGFAIACSQPNSPTWLWRIAFLIGGIGSILSYYMRKHLSDFYIPQAKIIKVNHLNSKRLLIFITSVLAGVTMWIPITYSNFYLTKILQYPTSLGLYSSLVGLVSFVTILPFVGMIYDKIDSRKYMLWTTIITCPLSIGSLFLLTKGYITCAQIGLMIAPALIGGPIHKLMNNMFPSATRGRNVGILLMIGLSFGGILPSISSYIVDKTRIDLTPAFLISIVSLIAFFCFYKLFDEKKLTQ